MRHWHLITQIVDMRISGLDKDFHLCIQSSACDNGDGLGIKAAWWCLSLSALARGAQLSFTSAVVVR